MKMEFDEVVRGVEVTVYAADFDGDESVGIAYGPETVYATRADNGEPFELTDDEIDRYTVRASEAAFWNGSDISD